MKIGKAPTRPWTFKEFVGQIETALKEKGIEVSKNSDSSIARDAEEENALIIPQGYLKEAKTLTIPKESLEKAEVASSPLSRLDTKHRTELYKSKTLNFSVYGVIVEIDDKLKIVLTKRGGQ